MSSGAPWRTSDGRTFDPGPRPLNARRRSSKVRTGTPRAPSGLHERPPDGRRLAPVEPPGVGVGVRPPEVGVERASGWTYINRNPSRAR
jgi:hypothetical protein